jgi:hypothetical protein
MSVQHPLNHIEIANHQDAVGVKTGSTRRRSDSLEVHGKQETRQVKEDIVFTWTDKDEEMLGKGRVSSRIDFALQAVGSQFEKLVFVETH